MSELSTVLLLACTTCLNAQVAQLPSAECDPTQQEPSAECLPATSTVAATSSATRQTSVQSILMLGPFSQGKPVVELQTQLQQLGHYTGKLDGIYGHLTKTAVTQFQQDNGLRADGIVGTKTQRALTAVVQSAATTLDNSTEPLVNRSTTADPSFTPSAFVMPESDTRAPAARLSAVPPTAIPPVVSPDIPQTMWSNTTASIRAALGTPASPVKPAFALSAGILLVAGWGGVFRQAARRNALFENDVNVSSDLELLLADLPASPATPTEPLSRPTKSIVRRTKTLVATIISHDCTAESAYTYSLIDDADGNFVLINRELWLTHRRPDQQKLNRYTVIIRCTDKRGVSVDQPFRIRVMPSVAAVPQPQADNLKASQGARVEALSGIS